MKKEFIERVIRERIVDTDKYRYIIKDCHDAYQQYQEIRRLPLSDLDTTNAIDGWETVWASKTKAYHIKPEFLSLWGEDCAEDTIITEDELQRLAQEWETTVDNLRQQLEEID